MPGDGVMDGGLQDDKAAGDGSQDGRVAGDASKRENEFQMATPAGYEARVVRTAEDKILRSLEALPPPRSWKDIETADRVLCRVKGIDRPGPRANGGRPACPVSALLVATT